MIKYSNTGFEFLNSEVGGSRSDDKANLVSLPGNRMGGGVVVRIGSIFIVMGAGCNWLALIDQ